MDQTTIRAARQLSENYSLEALVAAIAYAGAVSTNDMLNDFLADPDYVKTEGLPDAEKVRDTALEQATVTMPMLLTESDFGKGHTQKEGEGFLDFAVRIALPQVYAVYPQLYDLKINAQNVAKS